jgi:hypothetical protein
MTDETTDNGDDPDVEGAAVEPADADSFIAKVKAKLNDLTEVKVVTIVGDVPVRITSANRTTETTIDDVVVTGGSLVTIVKLLDGDVTTIVPEGLVGNGEVRAMHSDQVTKSLQVIPDHLNALVGIAERIGNIIRDNDQE